jgi:alpha-2-macroglobulin
MPYVAVNDLIPVGCEIIDPSLSVVSPELVDKISSVNNVESDYWLESRNHTEYRDQRCLLFADFLNRGTQTFSYLLCPTIEEAFYTPPAHVEEMYSPEVFGRTGECQVTIKK